MLIYNYKLHFVIFFYLIQLVKGFGEIDKGFFQVEVDTDHLETLYLDENDDSLWVGGMDWIYKFDLYNITNPKKELNLKTSKNSTKSQNRNLIKVIHSFGNYLFVCGTYGGQPRDWILRKSLEISQVKLDGHKSDNCGLQDSGTSVMVKDNDRNIKLYFAKIEENVKEGELSFLKLVDQTNIQTVDYNVTSKQRISSAPTTFIGSFDIGNEILFFYTEPAFDKDNQEFLIPEGSNKYNEYVKTIYSRVARVCKDVNINGTADWSTFIKARLTCSMKIEEKLVHFNKLKSIYAIPNNDEYFYALFTNEIHFEHAGICKFSKLDIEQAFNSSFKEKIGDKNSANDEIRKPNSCGKNLQYNQSSTNEFSLVTSVINATRYPPIWGTTTNDFKTLVVDIPKQLPGFENISCTVYYLASDMSIHRIIETFNKTKNNIPETQKSGIVDLKKTIDAMKISSRRSFIYSSAGNNIFQVNLRKCDEPKNEESICEYDPYCGWNLKSCDEKIEPPKDSKGGTNVILTTKLSVQLMVGSAFVSLISMCACIRKYIIKKALKEDKYKKRMKYIKKDIRNTKKNTIRKDEKKENKNEETTKSTEDLV